MWRSDVSYLGWVTLNTKSVIHYEKQIGDRTTRVEYQIHMSNIGGFHLFYNIPDMYESEVLLIGRKTI